MPGDAAALLQVQRRAQAAGDDVDRPGDRLALFGCVARLHVQFRQAQRRLVLVEQQADALMRRSGQDGAFQADPGIGAGIV
ncbi:hypothetical protein D3C79_929360 [compost metagenome]